MVKFGKNKLKTLNKQKRNVNLNNASNKVIKKLKAEKKVSFQKEILLKETAKSDVLVQNIKNTEQILKDSSKKAEKKVKIQEKYAKPKLKAVEKHKKRQKTQLQDTKLLLKLMKNK
ncbi:hypothetical protein RR48_01972 [Papilio machaon]|uniref:Uncharacterized protein n=1 Tax=Papilio machaon TaxID=76193 RepID=A0A0N1PJ67_PAPMA|nr:hypothetical protein RR48_01972 [Papilio machaon]